MMHPGRKKYQKRSTGTKFPKNKTFSYRSARRSSDTNNSNGTGKSSLNVQNNGKSLAGRLISKVINVLILLAVIISLAYLSYVDTNPVIKLDQTVIPRDQADYYDAVRKEISSSIAYTNKLTFNSDKFAENLKAEFPEINSVIVEIPVFKHRPIVNISVSDPSARLVTNEESYILDSEGRALFSEDKINEQFDISKLVSINDSSGHPVVLGEPVLTEQQINYIREVINQSNASHIPAQTFSLEFGGSAVDIKFQDASYIVKFSFYEDPKQSSGAYFAIREEINNGSVPMPQKYIDLRIPDKAYLK
ncbi:MAG: hypothetical protein WD885_02950 [Candidatus Saccharimonadales bacterium]